MIKSFKDFDRELKGQKIYEAIEENDEDIIKEEDIIVPETISNNKFLLSISKIVLKRLEIAGFDEFVAHPMVITIDDVPGVYFYNCNDESMNIVVCRNTMGKHVYLFKEFEIGTKNVADLVLSTKTLGFREIMDEMIEYLSPSTIEEGLICEWKVTEYGGCSDVDVNSIVKIGASVRQIFVNLLSTNNIKKASDTIWNGKESGDKDCILVCDEVSRAYGKTATSGLIRKVCLVFAIALGTYTKGTSPAIVKDAEKVIAGTSIKSGGTTSAITSATGVTTLISGEEMEEIASDNLEFFKKDAEKYKNALNGIYNTTVAMCNYVKNDGEISEDDAGWMETRCMIITGFGGVGKSRNVNKALTDMSMIDGKDYLNVSSSSTAMASLYKKFYDYNGKLLVFDDSSNLFKADYQKSFWKNALQSEGDEYSSPSVVALPVPNNNNNKSDKSKSFTYDPDGLTRQQRYFREIGESTPEDFEKYKKTRTPEIRAASPVAITSTEINEIIKEEWAELEDQRSPAMPTRFTYNGVIIIISNKTRAQLKAEVGAGDWGAIVDRMISYNLEPKAQSVWIIIKEIIETERDKTEEELPSKLCLIPRDITDEFIEEVERLITDPQYQNMTFRLVGKMKKILNSASTRPFWKDKLEEHMDINR